MQEVGTSPLVYIGLFIIGIIIREILNTIIRRNKKPEHPEFKMKHEKETGIWKG
jgi:hypothetical protein